MSTDPGIRTTADEPLEHLARLEQELAGVRDQLARSERLATLGTMVAAIAHEFNNILTPVMSYAELAIAAPEGDPLRGKALRKAQEGASRAAKISQALLGFAAPGSDEDAAAEVANVARDAVDCLPREPERDGVDVTFDIDASLRASIRPVALQQVILNLTMNAIEAMKPEGGSLRIAAERSTWNRDGSDEILLRISDTGPGIPEDVAATLFSPFSTTPTRKEHGGSGLGLAICRQLVETAGGTIEAISRPGDGAEFLITLPPA